ncbi:MAG TPA: hypothetical protein VNO43_02250 [Candidatus Eisenbacteria bacterium]|nr:hypothetical protein [Candidatus Eisenbacteria bacterium]
MKDRIHVFSAIAALLALFFAVAPVRAQGVEDRIRALEDELSRLKAEQQQVKTEQLELKKEAAAAAAALPTFTYRPGNGVLMEAADKSWGIRFSAEMNLFMPFESGKDHVGRTNGEVMVRRGRPRFNYCMNNCFYEVELAIDLDGFGTGSAINSTGTEPNEIMQRATAFIHFENINPWLPTLAIGGDAPNTINQARQGSSSTGSQLEYDLMSRNNGWNTGSAGWAYNLEWERRPLGIAPGTFTLQVSRGNHGVGGGLSKFSDKAHYHGWLRLDPFSQLKDKWLRGLWLEAGLWWCNLDRTTANADAWTDFNPCGRVRLQDHGPGGRQNLFTFTPNLIGSGVGRVKGESQYTPFGIGWTIGPYTLRMLRGIQNYNFAENAQAVDGRARNFLIGHDLFVWSPKGFLTGSATTPGSILLGFHFERNDVSCENGPGPCAQGVSRNRVLVREWDLWYFMTNRTSIGAAVLWYDASNLTPAVQSNLGIRDNGQTGQGGDWVDVIFSGRFHF